MEENVAKDRLLSLALQQQQAPIMSSIGGLFAPTGIQGKEPWRVRRWRVQLAGLLSERQTIAQVLKSPDNLSTWVERIFRIDREIGELRERIRQRGFNV